MWMTLSSPGSKETLSDHAMAASILPIRQNPDLDPHRQTFDEKAPFVTSRAVSGSTPMPEGADCCA
jgi:hypothetical protein